MGTSARLTRPEPWTSTPERCSLNDHLGALEVEAEADLAQTGLEHGPAQLDLVLGVEHQEAAAARPHQLAPERAVIHAEAVQPVDVVVAGAAGPPLLLLPLFAEQLR